MKRKRPIDRALRNWIAPKYAILGITPGSLRSAKIFDPRGPTRNTWRSPIPAAYLAAHQKIRPSLVGYQALQIWVVEDSIALSRIPNVPIIVEKEAYFSCMI